MRDWRFTTLGQFVSLQRGHDLPTDQRSEGDVPVMGSFGITGWHNVARANGPGVTVGRSGASIGVVSYIDRAYWPLNTCLFATEFHGNSPRFVYYFLKMLDLAAHNSGSAQPSLNRNYIAPIKIKVPDRAEQDDIVNLLGSLDDKIELNRRMNETLEAMAQAIFRDWFVDFGPTRRKLDGATDPVEIMGGLVADPDRARELADLFPARLGDDGLPEGWRNGRLEDVLDLAYGKSLTKGDRRDGPYPVYGSGGISGWHNTALVKGPSIVVGRKGTVGSLYWEDRDFYPIDTVFFVKSRLPMTFCYYLLQTLGLEGMNTDAAVPGLNRNNAYRLDVPVVKPAIIEAFHGFVGLWRKKIAANTEEIATLAATRDLLLPKLMSGEIRLRDAEAALEAAQ